MSDLRTRIAEALKTADRRVAGFIGYEERADAVIAELGLEEELTYGGTMRRYITDWEATTTPPGYWYDKDEADG